MKAGDLVVMPHAVRTHGGEDNAIGIVVDPEDPWDRRGIAQGYKRIGIMWSDGGGTIDYEPTDWLEVISEAR